MHPDFEHMVNQISTIVLGKKDQIRLALTCLFAKGHLLIEDIPGIGKTTLAKVLAKCLGLKFRRVQFTNDMLPGDILGVSVFDKKSSAFVFHPGPIFTQVLLADEINRATPKTQSALLEAMEEGQATIEGHTRPLEPPFFVIATQNPMEHSGTFPLPDSQLDRFLMRLSLGYPSRADERQLLRNEGAGELLNDIEACLMQDDVIAIQKQIQQVTLSDALIEYLQDLIDFTRLSGHFYVGLSPRAGLGLMFVSRAWTYFQGRDYVLPEDIQKVMPWVIGHRLRLKKDSSSLTHDKLCSIMAEVPIP